MKITLFFILIAMSVVGFGQDAKIVSAPTPTDTTKELIVEANYIMSDGETPLFAEMQVLEKAKRYALQEAGTYVSSRTIVQNFQLVSDEVMALTGGLMEVKVLEEKREYTPIYELSFYIRIYAKVKVSDVKEIQDMIANKKLVEEYKMLKTDYDSMLQEIAMLRMQLAQALKIKGKPQAKLNAIKAQAQIRRTEQAFQARQMYEDVSKGMRKIMKKPKDLRLEADDVKMKEYATVLQDCMELDTGFALPALQLADYEEKETGNKEKAKKLKERAEKADPERVRKFKSAEKSPK